MLFRQGLAEKDYIGLQNPYIFHIPEHSRWMILPGLWLKDMVELFRDKTFHPPTMVPECENVGVF